MISNIIKKKKKSNNVYKKILDFPNDISQSQEIVRHFSK
jgi:hypothetical protein